ncbi:hypothetical protein [Marinobacter sp.]|uniref:hypothetical protein n=1 Tax=Marinobacter sp. TaxID=50741 RepID=UPI002B269C4C|nr:hypothetical protein [Marinobacter sp.]
METNEGSNIPRKAFVILVLQAIAWILIFTTFFEDYSTGNDPAGAGMARGFAILLVVVPCMAFVFLTTFYFFKNNLPTRFKFISAFNYIVLFVVFSSINW